MARKRAITTHVFMGSKISEDPCRYLKSNSRQSGENQVQSDDDNLPRSTCLKRKRTAFVDPSRCKKQEILPGKKLEGLCKDCADIDFQAVLNIDTGLLQASGRFGVFIADLGNRLSRGTLHLCSLCQLFSKVRIRAPDLDDNCHYHLRAYSAFNPFNGFTLSRCPDRFRRQDLPCLAIVSTGSTYKEVPEGNVSFLFCVPDTDVRKRLFKPEIVSPQVDFQKLRQMLDYCQTYHKQLCCKPQPLATGMMLIDCKHDPLLLADLKLVRASDLASHPKYVALSYVWGDDQHKVVKDVVHPGNSDRLPKSICDAISTTKKLGYRYLWVDKYCIHQANHIEKEHQMSRMDQIYRGAVVTIIAAAGSNAHSGLPGVDDTPRTIQASLRIGDMRIIPSMHSPRYTIENSVWFSRAWTYQEGILPCRRFVFSEHQVYFECQSMHCREGWKIRTLDFHSHGRFRMFIHPGIFRGKGVNNSKMSRGFAQNLSRYRDMTIKYSAKVFSADYGDQDSLRAFVGIMNDFESSTHPVYQLWGLPFTQADEDHIRYNTTFVASLLWQHNPSVLSRRRQDHPIRRPQFPSWTWAGWGGAIVYPAFNRERKLVSLLSGPFLEDPSDACNEVDLTTMLRHHLIKDLDYAGFRVIRFKARMLVPKDLKFAIRFGKKTENPRIVWIRGYRAQISVSATEITRKNFQQIFRNGKNAFVLLAAEGQMDQDSTDQEVDTDNLPKEDFSECVNKVERDCKNYLHFLIIQPSGAFSVRVGAMIVRADLPSFEKKFEFVKSDFRLI